MFDQTLPNQKNIDLISLEAPNLWVRCRRRLFFQKNGPQIFEAPNFKLLVGTLPQAPFFQQKGLNIFTKCHKGGGGL